ncbi:MAG: CarD family transcriptional regulator [Anaerococcus hydrogenalis]|uniref:CarD family transcriptional regulator n=1 Tax=Anaerococcus TaxID=165779 RepID=UPI0002E68139|nr:MULTISPECIES: CarD family transcriptional regulator [Anaerococcus]MDU1315864.1 CarD family transcriptional regulator [Anaerococcus hydrogenalis]MDU2582596.1 CarD family transcriptional regulator [Anaerococcus hydrogenalis]MDU3152963.1 CarD family transcriptional regulator [Anaerococcus hydrogenalis]MDU3199446.1 CarD family transcriptional regulator [Anaerococcus hydrogenalis]MDU3688681.1 CarD family transcriptional regulator [Anaerococcus hydrogenalis]
MFKIGDKIVYPMHGAGIIDSVEIKEFLGEEKEYFILKMPIGNMDISIPKSNINKMNIRDVISKEEGEKILKILEEDPEDLNNNWNLRYRENQEILKTGDIFKIANMVRDLVALDDDKGLSTTEKKLLNRARRIMASELVMSGSLEKDDAEKMIDESIGL